MLLVLHQSFTVTELQSKCAMEIFSVFFFFIQKLPRWKIHLAIRQRVPVFVVKKRRREQFLLFNWLCSFRYETKITKFKCLFNNWNQPDKFKGWWKWKESGKQEVFIIHLKPCNSILLPSFSVDMSNVMICQQNVAVRWPWSTPTMCHPGRADR